MSFFNLFKKAKRTQITNSIGTFTLFEREGVKYFKSLVNASRMGQNIKLQFQVNGDIITHFQIEYLKKINTHWDALILQIQQKHPPFDQEHFSVVDILIPEKGNLFYDMDAEIVFKKQEEIISVILMDLEVIQVIEI